MYIGLDVKCPLFFSDFNEIWIFLTDFRKITIIKFHENNSSGSRRTDGETDMTKLLVAFLNSENASGINLGISKLKFPISF
jgi:predicted metal-binding protein